MLCQGVLFGLASALIFNTIVAVPSQWFAKKRALAMGVVFTGSGLGGTIWPIAIARMITKIGELSCPSWANRQAFHGRCACAGSSAWAALPSATS
jgi:MFS family permease